MKRFLIAPACCLLISATAQSAEVSSTVTFTNDYRLHGISQTAGSAAVQGSLDALFDSGVYAGLWGSNLDFGDEINLELDPYVGYGGELTADLAWDATAIYFTFQGDQAADIDYLELDLGLYYKGFTVLYAYSGDYLNTSEEGQYLALDYSYAIQDNISIDLHAGRSFGDYWKDIDIGDYSDYSVGVSGNVAGLDLSASYLFNSVDDAVKTDSGIFRNDDTLVLSISRSF